MEDGLDFEDQLPCHECDGQGAGIDIDGDQWECPECDGTGEIAP